MKPSSNTGRKLLLCLAFALPLGTFVVLDAQAGQSAPRAVAPFQGGAKTLANHTSGNVMRGAGYALQRPLISAATVNDYPNARGPKYYGRGARDRGFARPHHASQARRAVYWDYEGRPHLRHPQMVSIQYGYSRFAETPLEQSWGERPLAPTPGFVEVRRGPRVIYGTQIQPPPASVRVVYGEGPYQAGPSFYAPQLR